MPNSEYLITSDTLSGIANAIRNKTDQIVPIRVNDFADEIDHIQTGHTITIDGVEVERDLDLVTNNITVNDWYDNNDLFAKRNKKQSSKWIMLDKSHPIIPNVFLSGTDIRLNIKRYACNTGWANIIQNFVLFSGVNSEKTGIFKSNLYRVADRILYLVGHDNGEEAYSKLVDITDTSNPTVIYTGTYSDSSIIFDIVERNNGGLIIEKSGTGKIKTLEMNYTNGAWVIGSPIASDLDIIAEDSQSFAVGLLNDDDIECTFIACANNGDSSLHRRSITIYSYYNQGLTLLDTENVNYVSSGGSYIRGTEPAYAGKDADNNHYFAGETSCRIKVALDSSGMITSLTQLNNNSYYSNFAGSLFGDTKMGYDDKGSYTTNTEKKFYNLTKLRYSTPTPAVTAAWNIPYYTEV